MATSLAVTPVKPRLTPSSRSAAAADERARATNGVGSTEPSARRAAMSSAHARSSSASRPPEMTNVTDGGGTTALRALIRLVRPPPLRRRPAATPSLPDVEPKQQRCTHASRNCVGALRSTTRERPQLSDRESLTEAPTLLIVSEVRIVVPTRREPCGASSRASARACSEIRQHHRCGRSSGPIEKSETLGEAPRVIAPRVGCELHHEAAATTSAIDGVMHEFRAEASAAQLRRDPDTLDAFITGA